MFRRHARREPYTDAGVRRLPCFRCGKAAEFQWSVCAAGNLHHPLCRRCDVALNELVLNWMGHPERDRLIAAYREEKGEPCATA
jgi:hypothetical protein